MLTKFKSKSISFFHKQVIAVVGINILPLLIMSSLLYSNFIDDYKNNLIDVMSSKITLLASTSRSAILFDDRQTANALLSSLEQFTAARYAQIYDDELNLFAEFKREGQSVDMPIEDFENKTFFKNQNLYLSHDIMIDGDKLGTILISADTKSLKDQQQRYILIATFVFLGSLLLTYLLNWRLQKLLTAPITDLIGLVSYVAQQKKYHKRLENKRSDEIGDLILGVNTMLDTIEEHGKQLYDRANYDDLTQLPNRRLLTERLTSGIDDSRKNKTELALLFLDLDRFKVINDSLGHPIGDEVLIEVARKLLTTLRQTDSVFRWGGDEFVIMIEKIHQTKDIEIVVSKIIKELSKPTMVRSHLLHVSTSIGIARFPQDGEDSQSLLKHADISMYRAKATGPGHHRYFDQNMLDDSVQRLNLEVQVHKAFDNKEFFLVYQPKVSIDGEHIDGFETLIRWKVDDVYIPPDRFLPIVEDMGLMGPLSLWILELACTQNVCWQKAGFAPVTIAVNLPASFIMNTQCLENIASILSKTGMAAKYLEIEITENTFLDSTLEAVPVLQALKDSGVSIAIDDFGTGYSCMSYLQDLPIGTLKIDGSFVKGLGESKANDGIVQSIVTLGKSLNMKLVGECVETEQQLSILKSMGCDIIQGYLYSKPLAVDEATRFLADKNSSSITPASN